MADKVKGFLLYIDQAGPIEKMTNEQRGKLLKAMFDWHLGNKVVFDDPLVDVVFSFFEQTFRRDEERYAAKCEKLRANASKSHQKVANASKSKKEVADASKSAEIEREKEIERVKELELSTDYISSLDTEHSSNSVYCAEPATDLLLKGRKRVITGKRAETFKRFWDAFGDKRGIAQAIDAWSSIPTLTDSLVDRICEAAKQYADKRQDIRAQNGTPKMAQGWLNDRRWEDEPDEPTFTLINPRRAHNA